MRGLEDLIDDEDPGWPILKEWIQKASNKVQILPTTRSRGEAALLSTQVTTRSMMGAIVYETGGLLIDDGWIRILGAGCDEMKRSIPDWNLGKTYLQHGDTPGYLLVADDAIGGFYALNGGSLGPDAGKVYYNSPASLEWEALELSYSEFLQFCFGGDLDAFYYKLRWDNWRAEMKELGADRSYSFVPFLWTKEGADINRVDRRAVPIDEVYGMNVGGE